MLKREAMIVKSTYREIVFKYHKRLDSQVAKYKEMIEKEIGISKDKILEMYLNNVYLGSGAYGVKGAAKIYFNKNLDELTLPASFGTLSDTREKPAFF